MENHCCIVTIIIIKYLKQLNLGHDICYEQHTFGSSIRNTITLIICNQFNGLMTMTVVVGADP